MSLSGIFAGSEAEEMKDERIDGLVGKRVFLLKKDSDEDVCRARIFTADGALFCSDFAKSQKGCGRMQDWYAHFGDDAADDMRLSERTTIHDQGKEEAFEKCCGLVEGLFEGVVEVDVEFAVLMDVLLDTIEEDGGDEVLCCCGLGGDEDLGCSKSSVGCPGFRTGDGE